MSRRIVCHMNSTKVSCFLIYVVRHTFVFGFFVFSKSFVRPDVASTGAVGCITGPPSSLNMGGCRCVEGSVFGCVFVWVFEGA